MNHYVCTTKNIVKQLYSNKNKVGKNPNKTKEAGIVLDTRTIILKKTLFLILGSSVCRNTDKWINDHSLYNESYRKYRVP